jgi:hypothetical protein
VRLLKPRSWEEHCANHGVAWPQSTQQQEELIDSLVAGPLHGEKHPGEMTIATTGIERPTDEYVRDEHPHGEPLDFENVEVNRHDSTSVTLNHGGNWQKGATATYRLMDDGRLYLDRSTLDAG